MLIHGIPITLYNRTRTGTDAFNRPTYAETAETVDNVLIEPLSEAEILDVQNLTGRRAVYRLCLPKGDAHDWTDKTVGFYGQLWHTIGEVQEWIEAMVPLEWNRKVRVERIDGAAPLPVPEPDPEPTPDPTPDPEPEPDPEPVPEVEPDDEE